VDPTSACDVRDVGPQFPRLRSSGRECFSQICRARAFFGRMRKVQETPNSTSVLSVASSMPSVKRRTQSPGSSGQWTGRRCVDRGSSGLPASLSFPFRSIAQCVGVEAAAVPAVLRDSDAGAVSAASRYSASLRQKFPGVVERHFIVLSAEDNHVT
jgi:hypothetical protein